MKLTTLFTLTLLTLTSLTAAMIASTAQADDTDTYTSTHGLTFGVGTLKRTGDAIRAEHVRKVGASGTWLHQPRYLETPTAYSDKVTQRWVPYRSPYARRARPSPVAPVPYVYIVPFRHEFACRYLADCPCRYLAGC